MAKARLEKSWKFLLKEYEVPSYAKKYILEPLFSKQKYLEPILDAGCGTGFFSNLLSKEEYMVVSVDKNLDESQLHSCKKVRANIEFFNPKKMLIGDVLLINVLSCLEPRKRLSVLKNLKKIKSPDSKIFVINGSEELGDPKFKSETMKIRKISDNLVHVINKKCDGTFMEFDDYLIVDGEFRRYCANVGLEVLVSKELFFKKEKFPIFNFYILK